MTRNHTRIDLYDIGRFPSFQTAPEGCILGTSSEELDQCRHRSNLCGFRLTALASLGTWGVLVWQLVL